MALLQVRDCPADLYENLTNRAKSENRSIAQQTIFILKNSLGSSDANKQRRKEALALLGAEPILLPEGSRTPEELIREDRDR
ncbi:MAG: hypothetical protein VZQ80_03185 [Lachnospiraceae bacterium]|nr:hypothetical protein [Lachnospiraceae bacterium]